MGLIASYPDDLDDDIDIDDNVDSMESKEIESISHVDKHIFMDGYIRQIVLNEDDDYSIPQCLINLIINYFNISHCIMLYSRNDDLKRGRIDFIDLNQNKYNLQNVSCIKKSVHLNHKMHLNQRSTSFIPNIIFKHHNPYKSYHAIFTAKNIVRGGSVDAIIIDPDRLNNNNVSSNDDLKSGSNNIDPIECTLNLPFIGYGQTINDLKYSYSLKSLIAQDSFEGYINKLPLTSMNKTDLKWTRFKDKKYKMKVYGERQYLCNSCFIDNNNNYGEIKDNLLFVVNYECRGQIFNFNTEKWNKKDLSRFNKNRYRGDFGLCFDEWNQRCFISGGCIDEYNYKLDINENFVHWTEYYDFHKNKWYLLQDTINYHETNPCIWYKNHCLFIISSGVMGERKTKYHQNDKDIQYQYNGIHQNKIGPIEIYDTRCNKWSILEKNKQLNDIIDRNNDFNNNAYIPSKLLNCLF